MTGMPSCREVTRAVSGEGLEAVAMPRRLGVRLHLFICLHCRRYASQIRAIGVAAREVLSRPPGERESLARLRSAILRQLKAPGAE